MSEGYSRLLGATLLVALVACEQSINQYRSPHARSGSGPPHRRGGVGRRGEWKLHRTRCPVDLMVVGRRAL